MCANCNRKRKDKQFVVTYRISGIQKHILFAGIGAVGARTFDNYRRDYYAERDAVYRHYISLHPEDFPMPGQYFLSQSVDQTKFNKLKI